jgi:hypothetical protein
MTVIRIYGPYKRFLSPDELKAHREAEQRRAERPTEDVIVPFRGDAAGRNPDR